ncbi:hypothetical protein CFAM422_006683 [Trichoderma lentiforme]|uniref:Uncharacterized protein n=1 Tax=Trichoderma lentiforme TaxID=1567552 RepID=A0A9P4XE35_9HYPO|nr:hypothetical protein CFAM422_006683 [Trichoderma lentiforme]
MGTVPKHKPLDNWTHDTGPGKGQTIGQTVSRENETTSSKLQPSKKVNAVPNGMPSPLHLSRAASTKTQDLTSSTSAVASKLAPPHAEAPTTPVLKTIDFVSDECGELGLDSKNNATLIGRVNSFLNSHRKAKTQAIQIAWFNDDKRTLKRDTKWDSGRDVGSDDDDDDGLNPHQSIPAAVCDDQFPPNIKFAQVAAGDD